jgi:hypothetical protein
MHLYARSDDTRFAKDWLSTINSGETVKISVIDGDVSAQTAAYFLGRHRQLPFHNLVHHHK